MKKIISFFAITSLSLFVIAGCSSKNRIQVGDTISIIYTAMYSDGSLFDQNTKDAPLTFVVGAGQTIQGIDEAVVGMKVGKSKTITITPDKGYGKLYQQQNVQKVGKLIFDKLGIVPKIGSFQKLDTVEGIIKGIETDDQGNELVLFDINPRQTWDTLKYKVTVLAKNEK